MIKYSWKQILRATDGNIYDVLTAVRSLCPEYKPENNKSKMYLYRYHRDLSGDSYLLNPIDLLNSTIGNTYQIVQYIYLASFRNTGNYTLTGDKSLDLYLCPITDMNKLKQNPLLIVSRDRIKFKYEELK